MNEPKVEFHRIDDYFILKSDFHTPWYVSLEKVTCFGVDAGPRLWIKCDGQEYGTHHDVVEQFEKFKRCFFKFKNPTSNGIGIGIGGD